jgi:pimeloyl-ACP methyl ester carboxylesterase
MLLKSWKCVLTLCATVALAPLQAADSPAEITGEWNGVIAGQLRVIFKIERNADKSLHGVLESPDQNNAVMPMDEVTFDGKRAFAFRWKSIAASYEGELSDDRLQLAGTWQQGGARVPLSVRRKGAAAVAKLQATTRGRIPLEPCFTSDGVTQALCGSFEVFENRAARTGRKIALNLMILPARAEKPAADPIFGFAGGPGQAATTALPLASFIVALQKNRDIVLIDQRGTGKSNPLHCKADPKDVKALIEHSMSLERLAACRAELEKHADLTQYSTSNFTDDVEDVREALGYDKINLVGGSYGTMSGLDYLRRHGSRVRSVVLEGVAAPDARLPLSFARSIQSSLEHLFTDCAADAACHKDFPDLKQKFETLVKRLDREPAKFDFQDSPAGKQQIALSRGAFVTSLRSMLYQPSLISEMPYLIDSASRNDWSGYADVSVTIGRALIDAIARGMSYSVICGEGPAFISEPDIRRETEGTYLGDFDVRLYQKRCASWPKVNAAKSFVTPVRSDVPTLLISGEEDPGTPPYLAKHAAETLSHSRVVSIPHGSHSTGSACIDRMMVQFVDAGSEKSVDAGCADQIRNPPFVTLEQVEKARVQARQ